MAKVKKQVTVNHFEYNGAKYSVIVHACHIPGIGNRTAAEILVDEESKKFLVENKCSGIISEVFDEQSE